MATLLDTAADLVDNQEFFAKSSLFDSVATETIEHYIRECEVMAFDKGEILLTPETPNSTLYVLIAGGLEVRLDSLERAPLTRLAAGECVGEMSMIESRTPSAYVVASIDSTVLAISNDLLWAMIGASHAIARNLLIILSGRLRTDNVVIADSAVIIRHFQKKSFTDALTGLNNRRWMEDFFTREIGRSQLNSQSTVLAVVDIDHFSDFNNQFGHLVGDMALGAVAEVLMAQFRTNDLIARYGGDEFVVLMPGIEFENAQTLAQRVREGLVRASQKLATAVADCPDIKVSIGMAIMSGNDTLKSLIEKADRALYRAKEKGRDQISD